MKFCLLTDALVDVATYVEKCGAHARDPEIKDVYETIWFLLHAVGRGESEDAYAGIEALLSALYAHEIEAKANDA